MNNDLQIRTSIMELEGLLLHGFATGAVTNNEDQTALKHLFTPTDDDYGCSTYSRELFMPAGMVVVGKLHKKPHLTFLMSGTMLVVSEDGGTKRLKGPLSFVSPAGVKRAFYIEEDSTLVCVHLTKETEEANLAAVEEEVISPSYEAMGLEEPNLTGLHHFLSGLHHHKQTD